MKIWGEGTRPLLGHGLRLSRAMSARPCPCCRKPRNPATRLLPRNCGHQIRRVASRAASPASNSRSRNASSRRSASRRRCHRRSCRRRSRPSPPAPRHCPPAIRRENEKGCSTTTARACAGWRRNRCCARRRARVMPDMRKAALFLEADAALVVERALAREQAFLPAGQEHGVEFEPLGGMHGHDRDRFARLALVGVHHQRDVLEEAGEVLELLHRAHQLLEVFEAAGGVGGAVLLPHFRVPGFIEHDLRQLAVRRRVLHGAPAVEARDQLAQRIARARLHLVGLDDGARRLHQAGCAACGRGCAGC